MQKDLGVEKTVRFHGDVKGAAEEVPHEEVDDDEDGCLKHFNFSLLHLCIILMCRHSKLSFHVFKLVYTAFGSIVF